MDLLDEYQEWYEERRTEGLLMEDLTVAAFRAHKRAQEAERAIEIVKRAQAFIHSNDGPGLDGAATVRLLSILDGQEVYS